MRYGSVLRQLPSKFIPRNPCTPKKVPTINNIAVQQLRSPGYVCRDAFNECDLPETCTGESGQCPADVYQKNGSPCGVGYSGMEKATGEAFRVCFNALPKFNVRPNLFEQATVSMECVQHWTLSARKSGVTVDWQPTSSATSSSTRKGRWMVIAGWTKPDITSNVTQSKPSLTCGWRGNSVNCLNSCSVFLLRLHRNVQCGSLQCKEGDHQPIIDGMDHLFSRTIISIRGVEYECKWVRLETCSHSTVLIDIDFSRATSGTILASTEFPEHGLVRDGTPCGENLVCVNQTCVSLFPYIDTSKCPTNHLNVECAGNGVSCCRECSFRSLQLSFRSFCFQRRTFEAFSFKIELFLIKWFPIPPGLFKP